MFADISDSNSRAGTPAFTGASPPPTRGGTDAGPSRTRRVRVGSTSDSRPASASAASCTSGGFTESFQPSHATHAPGVRPSHPSIAVSTEGGHGEASASLLRPVSRGGAGNRGGGAGQPRLGQAEEEAFLRAIASGKAEAVTPVTVVDVLKPSWESENPSSAAAGRPPSRLTSGASLQRSGSRNGGRSAGAAAAAMGSAGTTAFPTGRPGSAHNVNGSVRHVSGLNRSALGSRDGDARKPTTPTSTALLFPTSEWIRTALGQTAKRQEAEQRHSSASRKSSFKRGTQRLSHVAGGGAVPPPPSVAAQATAMAAIATAPSSRDTALRLHERRVKDALRSQDEMRNFSAILRRLEEEGAHILKEQRRRRHGRRGSAASQRGRTRGRGGRGKSARRRLSVGSQGSEHGGTGAERPHGGGEDGEDGRSSDAFSDVSDGDDESNDDGGLTGNAMPNVSNTAALTTHSGLAGGGPSARVVAEVRGAENMSRVALIKLRDRTAREWVVLQRRRLEQRRGGPPALHRNMHASQLRLQLTRTRDHNREERRAQNALAITAGSEGAAVAVLGDTAREAAAGTVNCSTGEELEGMSTPLDAEATRRPAGDDGLGISWGETEAQHTAMGGDGAQSDGHQGGGEGEARLRVDSGDSAPSAGLLPDGQGAHATVSHGAAADADASCSLEGKEARRPSQLQPLVVDQTQSAAAELDPRAATVNPMQEDRRLRQELHRLLLQANESTLYGLEQCLSGREGAVDAAAAPGATGATRSQPAQADTSSKGSPQGGARDGAASARSHDAPPGAASPLSSHPSAQQRAWSPGTADHYQRRHSSALPVPLHRSFGQSLPATAAAPAQQQQPQQQRGSPRGNKRGGASGVQQAATEQSRTASQAEASRHSLRSSTDATVLGGDADLSREGHDGRPPASPTPVLPPLSSSSSPLPSPTPAASLSMQRGDTPKTAAAAAAVASRFPAASLSTPTRPSKAAQPAVSALPSVKAAKAGSAATAAHSLPPRKFASPSSKKKNQRRPLPVERGVGEHAAVLLHHEILLTRRHEMEVERGNAREIERACATLQQLMPLRAQLLEQDLQKSGSRSNGQAVQRIAGRELAAGTVLTIQSPPPQQERKQPPSLPAAASPAGGAALTVPVVEAACGAAESQPDRSYQPQSILHRHRQLLYAEAVRMEAQSRYAARMAYMDVLTELAERHVPSISWPVVAALLKDARAQLLQEAEATVAESAQRRVSPSGRGSSVSAASTAAAAAAAAAPASAAAAPRTEATPRDQLQRLISTHLGVLELSQWPVQEVLHHLAALYRVPLYLLHEGIAEQQRRFAHSYNYEERFRAVDKTIIGSAVGNDSVLRLTLHRCRRPPLAPARETTIAVPSSTAAAAPAHGGVAAEGSSDGAAAGFASVESRGESLYFVRVRMGQQSVASSAVPVSSSGGGGGGGAGRFGLRADGDGSGHGWGDADGAMEGGQWSGLDASGHGGHAFSSSSSAAKVLSFLSQTLTMYLTPADLMGQRRRADSGATRGFRAHSAKRSAPGNEGEAEESSVLTVELMQTGVDAPLARGEVDLAALGLNLHGGSNRIQAQNIQIALKRKGYRTAELKATLEMTS